MVYFSSLRLYTKSRTEIVSKRSCGATAASWVFSIAAGNDDDKQTWIHFTICLLTGNCRIAQVVKFILFACLIVLPLAMEKYELLGESRDWKLECRFSPPLLSNKRIDNNLFSLSASSPVSLYNSFWSLSRLITRLSPGHLDPCMDSTNNSGDVACSLSKVSPRQPNVPYYLFIISITSLFSVVYLY